MFYAIKMINLTNQMNAPANPNVANYNPELQTIDMTCTAVALTPLITSSALYVYYFSKSKSPQWSEFEYFLMDFTIHIATAVVMPFIMYCKNSKLRGYVFNMCKECFTFNRHPKTL